MDQTQANSSLINASSELIKTLCAIYMEHLKRQQLNTQQKKLAIIIKFLVLLFIGGVCLSIFLCCASGVFLLFIHMHGLTWINSLLLLLGIHILILLPIIYSCIYYKKQLN